MDKVKLFHAPKTRSTGALCLLEECGVAHDLVVLNMKAGEHKSPEYLAINPMGKVPTILHNGAVVTEQAAVYIYLADLYPQAGLAPKIGDKNRGPYLRWMVFYGSAFEPAVVDKAQKREQAPASMCPYGDYDTMLKTVTNQLERAPFLLGDTFQACDMLWGMALGWTTKFGIVEATPTISSYIGHVMDRPAVKRAIAKDAEFAASQAQG
jgi:glutathione S-transferase